VAPARGRDPAPLQAQLGKSSTALPQLDFGLVQAQGLLARMTGRSRHAGSEFMAQYQQVEDSLGGLAAQVSSLHGKQGGQARGTEIALLELEVETRALQKIIEQGAKWLHDMRAQLKAREASASTDAQKQDIRRSAARCEILVARLKALRTLVGAAQQAHDQAREAASRRAGIVQTLQQALSSDVREWRARISPLASAAAAGRAPAGIEPAMESHRELQLCIKQAAADCSQLQVHEATLGACLETLGAQVRACSQ
jgi:chromosome segregation ATPase